MAWWLDPLTPGTEGTACCSVFDCVKGEQQAPGGCFHVNFHVLRRLNHQNQVQVILIITVKLRHTVFNVERRVPPISILHPLRNPEES